jgi:hypothetical protein
MIAIKDTDMPTACILCPLFDGEYDICNDIGKIRANLYEEKPKNCPLVEIVTCEHCKHRHIDEDLHGYHCERYHNVRFPVYNDFWCADGKRKEE